MSITLYREGLPRVEIHSPVIDDREGMLVGLADSSHMGMHAAHGIVMDQSGNLHLMDLSYFRVQFHYDPETDEWVDENASESETDRE